MGIVRDARYLGWRYLDCAFAPYQAFGLVSESGELRGLYIAREDWTGPPILALAELLVPEEDPAAVAWLLQHACAEARSRGQQRVELWCRPDSTLFRTVIGLGFRAEDSPFHLCIKPYEPELDLAWIEANWYFSIGDTDVF